MTEDSEMIAAFVRQMREEHAGELEGITLPEGTLEYVRQRVVAGDADTVVAMLKIGYLMGLQTGVSVSQDPVSQDSMPGGSLKA